MQRPSVFATLLLAAVGAAGLHQLSGTSANPDTSTGNKAVNEQGPGAAENTTLDKRSPKTTAEWEQEGKITAKAALRDEVCSFTTGGEYCRDTVGMPTYKASTETIIAILPDPIHTSIDLEFDRALEGIQYGLEDSGWILDRRWLPWTWLQSVETLEKKNLTDQVNQRFYKKGFEEEPGVVLFRHSCDQGEADCDKTLVLLIVGSSPLSGVLAEQFREAVTAAQTMTGFPDTLNILGPGFSGAVPSLASLLEEQTRNSTSLKQINIVEQASRPVLNDPLFPDKRFGKVHISRISFGAAASDIVHGTVKLLKTQLGSGTKVATLGEDESAYGKFLSNPERTERGQPDLTLSFPRGIAHLRNAYERTAVFGFGNASVQQRFNLSLDLQTVHEDEDTLSSFSQQKATSDEAIVRQITSALQGGDINVVVLSGTDVLDELFMVRLLYRADPNIAIVVLDTDLLFLRPGDDEAYHHLFAVSTFPLMPMNSHWTARKDFIGCPESSQRRLFSDAQAETMYLSTLFIVEGLSPNDSAHRSSNLSLRCAADYSSPFEPTSRPPLWLLTRGVQGYWPLATITMAIPADGPAGNLPTAYADPGRVPDNQDRCYIESLLGDHAPIPLPAVVALSVALVVCWLLIAACNFRTANSLLFSNRGMSLQDTQPQQTLLKSALCMLGLAVIAVMLPSVTAYHSARILFQLACLTIVTLAVTSVLLLYNLISLVKGSSYRYVIIDVLVILIGVGSAVVLWRPALQHDSGCIYCFFLYRSPYLFSGVSPLLPVLLLLSAIAFTTHAYAGRIFLAEPWKPKLPSVPCGSDLPADAAVEPINDLGGISFTKQKLLLWLSALVATGLIWCVARPLPSSLDGPRYSIQYQILAGLVTMLLLHELLRAARLWFLLHSRLLLLLERTPLRRGFDRVRGVSWTMVRKTFSSDPDLVYLARRRSRELALSSESRLNVDSELHAHLAREWTLEQGAHRNEERIDAKRWASISHLLSASVADVLRQLEDTWHLESGPVTAKDGKTDARLKVLEDPAVDGRTPAQEEFAALAYIQYIHVVLLQIRDSLLAVAVCFLLLSTSVSVYPFLNRHAAAHTLLYLFGATTAVSIAIYLQMNRDPILSRTAETEPGKLDFDFYEKAFSTVSIPLVGLLLSLFPELSGFLLGLLGSTK